MQHRTPAWGEVWDDPARQGLAPSQQPSGYSAGEAEVKIDESNLPMILGIAGIALAGTFLLGRLGAVWKP